MSWPVAATPGASQIASDGKIEYSFRRQLFSLAVSAGDPERDVRLTRANHEICLVMCPPFRSLRIEQNDGCVLHVRQWGEGGHSCLLIHGFGDGGYVWEQFAQGLASYGRILAVDLRGHGESGWDPHTRYDLHRHVKDIKHVLATLGVTNVVLVGHSLGGEIAVRVAEACPRNLLGLVLVDFGPDMNPTATKHVREEFLAAHRVYRTTAEYALWLQETRPLMPSTMSYVIAENALRAMPDGDYQLKSDPAIAASGQSPNSQAAPSLWALIKAMPWPVLIVRGVASAVLPRSVASEMLKALPNGRLQSVPFAGHAVMIDNPEGFANAVGPFMTDLLR